MASTNVPPTGTVAERRERHWWLLLLGLVCKASCLSRCWDVVEVLWVSERFLVFSRYTDIDDSRLVDVYDHQRDV